MKRWLCSLAIASFLTVPAMAEAAQNALERARILFDAGVQAYTAGRYNEAVESFKEAYVLSNKSQALFSLAQAERRLFVVTQDPQFLRNSIEHFRKYLEVVPEGGRRGDAAEALEQLDVLAARGTNTIEQTSAADQAGMGKLLVSTTTPGATISVDGAKAAESPALEVVKPGKHIIRVSAPGYITEEREVVAIEKSLLPVEISLREQPAYLSVTTRAGASIAIDGRSYGEAPIAKRIEMHQGSHTVRVSLAGYHPRQTLIQLTSGKTNSLHVSLEQTRQRILSYVFFGAAGFSLVGAGAQGIFTFQERTAGEAILKKTKTGNLKQEELEAYNSSVATAEQYRNLSLATLVTAGVFGVAGAITYLYDPQRPSDNSLTVREALSFSVTLTPSNAGIGVTGRF